MDIARLTPYPLAFTVESLDSNTDYVAAILNSHTSDLVEIGETSDSDGNLTVTLPSYFQRYDDEYLVEIYISDGEDSNGYILGDLVHTDGLAIYRPYLDPATLADTDDTISEMRLYEQAARLIINSIADGFYYQRRVYVTEGNGSDYMPISGRLCKVVKCISNDQIVFDSENTDTSWENYFVYQVTADHTAITQDVSSYNGFNRRSARNPITQAAASDTWSPWDYNPPSMIRTNYGGQMFINGYDYTFVVEQGWPFVPSDIKMATRLLINDLKCQGVDYARKYISQFTGDQFGFKLDGRAFVGTGNKMVDDILLKYPRKIDRIGVL